MTRSFPDLRAAEDALLARDFLYDDPESYRAGVAAGLRALEEAAAGAPDGSMARASGA